MTNYQFISRIPEVTVRPDCSGKTNLTRRKLTFPASTLDMLNVEGRDLYSAILQK